jgi:DHA2 family multidrug resistance protein
MTHAVPDNARPALEVSPARHRLITASAMLATVMQTLDMTIANVALPHMQGSLAATQDQTAWVLTSYIVVSAVLMPLTGFLSARFGRKQLFVAAVTLFTLTSLLCGLAQTLPEMVLFRILQGAAGAVIIPMSQSLMLDINPPSKQGQAMALWGAGVTLGPILGPTIGGWLTEYYDWRWVFLINLPLGILAVAGLVAAVPRTPPDKTRRLDATGFFLLAAGIACTQLVLDRGETLDWYEAPEIWIETMVAALGLYLFVVHTLTARDPFLPPRLFRDRNFVASLLLVFIAGVVILATMALLPPFLQHLGGYTAYDTGLLLAPRGVGVMLTMIVVGKFLLGRLDPRWVIFTGFVFVEISLWGMTQFTMHPPVFDLVWTGLLQGIGLGCVFAPVASLTTISIEPALRTEAASLFSLLRNLGSSFGVSVVAAEFTRGVAINTAQLSEHVQAAPAGALAASLGSTTDPVTVNALLLSQLTQEAALIAYLNDFRLVFIATLFALPLVFLYRKPAAAAGAPAVMVAD